MQQQQQEQRTFTVHDLGSDERKIILRTRTNATDWTETSQDRIELVPEEFTEDVEENRIERRRR